MGIGRPRKIDDLTLHKLKEAFLMGCTDSEACVYAGIVPSTLYNYQSDNPDFLEQKETYKQNPFMKARKVVLDALEAGDIATAHKVLDRRDKMIIPQDETLGKDPLYLTNEELMIIANGG